MKTVLVDDHEILLDGLISLLSTQKKIEIIATFTNPTSVRPFMNANHVDLLITDIEMIHLNGFELIEDIKKIGPIFE